MGIEPWIETSPGHGSGNGPPVNGWLRAGVAVNRQRWYWKASACAEPTVEGRPIADRVRGWSTINADAHRHSRLHRTGWRDRRRPGACWRRSQRPRLGSLSTPGIPPETLASPFGTATGPSSLFTVKGNAPETFQTLETIDWDRDASSHFCENDEKAHGRIQQRRIQVLKPLRGLINYPSVRQMFRITRKRHRVKTGEASIEVTYGLTSLPPQQVDAERLLALNRGHWVIENRNHRPRDTTFGEDASLMHTGHGPSNNAIVNHTALAIIPSRLPPSPSRGSALCHGSGRSRSARSPSPA